MANGMTGSGREIRGGRTRWQMSVEKAHEYAKAPSREPFAASVVGVRFRDSGRVSFFQSNGASLDVGTWVACTTSRGQEAGRVVVAPKQFVMSQLDGALKPIDRVLNDGDFARIEQQRRDAARVMRRAGEIARSHDFGMTPVSAEFAFDGASVRIAFSGENHSFVEDFRAMLVEDLGMDVYLHQVGARDEARLIGGLGTCGRTLCRSSWLPMYMRATMGMAENRDASLNPTKVSGHRDRLPCGLSYENEQYKKAKQVLPRLGQRVVTPDGEGMVVSLQVLQELVTVRFTDPYRDQVYPAAELLAGHRVPKEVRDPVPAAPDGPDGDDDRPAIDPPQRRRRRRNPRSADSAPSSQD